MRLVIYKYALAPFYSGLILGVNHDIEMPEGAKILSIQDQNNAVTIWAEVDADVKEKQWRHFGIFGTGFSVETDQQKKYIATLQKDDFVWHIYEYMAD